MNLKQTIDDYVNNMINTQDSDVVKICMKLALIQVTKDLLEDMPHINCVHVNRYGNPLHNGSYIDHARCKHDWYNLAVKINEWKLKKLKELDVGDEI